jgi:hypothetical protein
MPSPEDQLSGFLAKYDPRIVAAAREVRARLRALVPGALELVYDNYNALVIGYGASERPSEAVLSIAVMPKWVTLCFLQGVQLQDPGGLLRGSGNLVRNVRLAGPSDLDAEPIRLLITQSIARSQPPFDPDQPHRLIIRSISAKQRPRRPKPAGGSTSGE